MQYKKTTNYSSQVIHGEYYPHIDGIRAVAVLPVVLFHILAALCPGGFAGVDVFFVISGYLITGGILRDLEKDRFTIRNFYHRRIRRIMPAYFAMIAGVFAVGCILYYAQPLINLGEAVSAGTCFAANLHFWRMGGDYFAPRLHSQALLHLWSLSVEEQFYLFIPLLCAIIWKFRCRLVAPALALLAALSLSGAVYAVMTGKQNVAFYFLHLRAWELLVGSLLSLAPALASEVAATSTCRGLSRSLSITSETVTSRGEGENKHALLSTLGLLLVVLTYVGISSKTPFPGLAALPPVIGTALLIRYGQCGWVFRILSCRPFVLVGKLSYSLYLWHWPVSVFWKYAVYDQLVFCDYIGMLILSLVAGYLSWRYIELPVRTSLAWTINRTFVFASTGIVVLCVLGWACVHYQGWPTGLHPRANEWAGQLQPVRNVFLSKTVQGFVQRIESAMGKRFCEYQQEVQKKQESFLMWGGDGCSIIGDSSAPPQLLLVGDSRSGSLRYGMDKLLKEKNIPGYAMVYSATDVYDMSLPESRAMLKKLNDLSKGSKVILAEQWARHAHGDAEGMFKKLEEFARHIRDTNNKLYVVTDVPNYKYSAPEMAARLEIIKPRRMETEWQNFSQSEYEYNCHQGWINARLRKICQSTDAVLIPIHLALRVNDEYISFYKHEGKIDSLYRDEGHLSQSGSLLASTFISPYLFPEN